MCQSICWFWSMKEYSGRKSHEDEVFIMRYDLGSAASCPVTQLATLCTVISTLPGISGWATGCTRPHPKEPESKQNN